MLNSLKIKQAEALFRYIGRGKRICITLLTAYFLLPASIFSQQWHTLPNAALAPYTSTPVGVWSGWTVEVLKTINNKLYIGGAFGGACFFGPDYPLGNSIAIYNGSTWDSLGYGINGIVHAMEYFNGELYAGYENGFACSGGTTWPNIYVPNTTYLAKWNGIGPAWLAVDSPSVNDQILIMKYNGDLYMGGGFSSVGGVSCNLIVRYNGSAWNNMQGGLQFGSFPEARTMEVYNGELIVAGDFKKAGNVPCNNIARWNGTKWDSLGAGVNGNLSDLVVDTISNVLYAIGLFNSAGGVPVYGVAKWDGANWSAVGGKPPVYYGGFYKGGIFKGELYVSGATFGSPLDSTLIKWNGSAWNVVQGPNGEIRAMEVYNGNLYIGGTFNKIDTTTVNYIACYGDSCPGTPITLTLPYGVKELKVSGLKFKVYPNPTTGEITIATDEKGTFTASITNAQGKEVARKNFEKEIKISLPNTSKGIYTVKVCDEKGRVCHTERVVIEE